LLVHSKKYGYLKFPGGGIESGEDHVQALCREVREETGLEVIPDSIREFGYVPRRQKDQKDENWWTKHCMREEGLDLGLLMLMEADLMDDMGALGIVMDCMITESRNPGAQFEDCLDHITRYTLRQQEEKNPMVTPEAIAFWEEKTNLVRQFVNALRRDVML